MADEKRFPEGFVWGVATSSYQIEGAVDADGRGESIWDVFCRIPGKVHNGEDGAVACDHYRRFREDVAMMKRLGVQAYRFSIAWPRIFPTGHEAEPCEAGLAFYDALVDALLEAGITPWVTLYHWDLPATLGEEGGWTSRSVCDAFVRYTDAVTKRLGDRVTHWITHNEPWCVSMLGYQIGEHAPGHKDWGEAIQAAHHVLLSHGMAVPVIRRNVPGAKVGITLNFCPAYPASPSEADAAAAKWFDGWFNRWFVDPVYGRGYPEDMVASYRADGRLPADWGTLIQPGDVEVMGVETDFLGINFYSRGIIRSETVPEEDNAPRTVHPTGVETDMGWEVFAPSLTKLLHRMHDDYPVKEIVITENGCAYPDGPSEDGAVHDARRVDYFQQHIRACHDAIAEGVPLSGYFAWSLMDNFEWAFGYQKRFGLVYVDYETQQRIPKDAALWYRAVMARNGLA